MVNSHIGDYQKKIEQLCVKKKEATYTGSLFFIVLE